MSEAAQSYEALRATNIRLVDVAIEHRERARFWRRLLVALLIASFFTHLVALYTGGYFERDRARRLQELKAFLAPPSECPAPATSRRECLEQCFARPKKSAWVSDNPRASCA